MPVRMSLLHHLDTFILWLVLFPLLIGMLPCHLIAKQKKTPCQVYLCGFFTMLGIFQIPAVIIVLQRGHLSSLIRIMFWIALVLSFLGFVLAVVRITKTTAEESFELPSVRGKSRSEVGLWIVFYILLALQLVASVLVMTADGDDAYYVGQALVADVTDLVYYFDPYTGAYSVLDYRHALAPCPLFIALLARKSGLHAAVVAHTVLPSFLIVASYMIYMQIGRLLFQKDKKRLPMFMVLICLLNDFGIYSRYTRETFFLTRTWQGKSVLANLVIPMAFLILLAIVRRTEPGPENEYEDTEGTEKRTYGLFVMLFLVNMTGALSSSLGLLLLIVLETLFILLAAVRNRRPMLILGGILAMIPCYYFMAMYAMERFS